MPIVREAEAAQVLHRGQEAGREYVDAAQAAASRDRDEAHAVAHAQQRRRRGRRIEQPQRGAADQPPAAGRSQRIDAGLAPPIATLPTGTCLRGAESRGVASSGGSPPR